MDTIGLTDPQTVLDALKNGAKIAVFALDAQENPDRRLSGVIFRVSANSDKTTELLEPAFRYVKANFNKDIKLSALADLCDVSPSYFSRMFSRCAGMGLNAYVTALRLKHACRLLKTTSRSVVGIACEAGYVDCGYFYKLFRKKYGCTPLEYRRSEIIP